MVHSFFKTNTVSNILFFLVYHNYYLKYAQTNYREEFQKTEAL